MTGDLTVYGASDDLVVISDGTTSTECEAYEGITLRITEPGTPDAGVLLRLEYGPIWSGAESWAVAVSRLDEGAVIPWPVEVRAHPRSAYSVSVVIEGGAKAVIEVLA